MKMEFEKICVDCGNVFRKIYAKHYLTDSRYKPLCNECIRKRISNGRKKNILNKIQNSPYESLPKKLRKKIIWGEQNERCLECGFNLYPLEIGPYQLHHKDRNSNNIKRENEIILCYNCHFMTGNWGFTGRKHKQESIDIMISKQKNKKRKN